MLKKFFKATLAIVSLSSAIPASAEVILSSDFSGTAGDPSNITWIENNVSVTNTLDPQNLSLTSLNLFANSTNMFAVNHNIHNQGSWFVDILISASSLIAGIDLDFLSLDASIYNKKGNLQPAQRDLSFSLEIFDGVSSIFTDTVSVFSGDNNDPGFTPSETIDFDLSGLFLDGGEDYSFRLTASGTGGGNNAGFDNFLLTGTSNTLASVSVSAPGSMIILAMSLAILLFRSRK